MGLCVFSPADGGVDDCLPLTADTVMCKYEQKPFTQMENVPTSCENIRWFHANVEMVP